MNTNKYFEVNGVFFTIQMINGIPMPIRVSKEESEIRTFVAYFGFFGFKPTDIASKLEDRISDVDARTEFRFSKREYLVAKNQEARDEYDIDD